MQWCLARACLRRMRTGAALRSVSPHYISFALDNAFVRVRAWFSADLASLSLPHTSIELSLVPPRSQDPKGISGVVLPQDATNSTRIDFQDPLLNKIMPLVSGGYIRIGGTYTVRHPSAPHHISLSPVSYVANLV